MEPAHLDQWCPPSRHGQVLDAFRDTSLRFGELQAELLDTDNAERVYQAGMAGPAADLKHSVILEAGRLFCRLAKKARQVASRGWDEVTRGRFKNFLSYASPAIGSLGTLFPPAEVISEFIDTVDAIREDHELSLKASE